MNIVPVILCGGSGTRMWPASRAGYPKQFLALNGDKTLLQQCASRAVALPQAQPPVVVTNQEQRFLVAEQLRDIGIEPSKIILEPVGRNTAPAVAAAAIVTAESDPAAILLILPSDHAIENVDTFSHLIGIATEPVSEGRLATFGIEPDSPHTGYGYILHGKDPESAHELYSLKRFVEKPNLETAQKFLASGDYLWNSGMFMCRADVYLNELGKYQPEMLAAVRDAVVQGANDLDFLRLAREPFEACPSDSIDYAVMEHTDNAIVVKASELGWNDIGSWSALADITERDENGNSLIGDIFARDCQGCYIRAEGRMVAALGVKDLVIVETADAVLVAHKDNVQDVKTIVAQLQAAGRSESMLHRRVFRPWGSYEGIDQGDRFQVKRIIVKPGASLSLQMHYHRAEHWIVVKGTARVVCGEKSLLLAENESTYIPLGTTHRLENPGHIPLELIEVQSGAYLGEDDIVRFEDHYGRTAEQK